jgi:hypothetical protein
MGLLHAAHDLFASIYVDDSSSLTGWWRFHSITSVALTAGGTYYMASQGGEGYVSGTSGITVDPRITFIVDAWQ